MTNFLGEIELIVFVFMGVTFIRSNSRLFSLPNYLISKTFLLGYFLIWDCESKFEFVLDLILFLDNNSTNFERQFFCFQKKD